MSIQLNGDGTITGVTGISTVPSTDISYTPAGTGAVSTTVQTELRKTVRASNFAGADFGAKLTAAIAAMPSTGGIIDCTDIQSAQTISTSVVIDKPVRIELGGATFTLGSSQILIKVSGASIYGIGKASENTSPTRFVYSGIDSGAIVLRSPVTATALFGVVLQDFEVSALGSSETSASAHGIASVGTRYCEFNNIQIFNFRAGKGYYFTGNGAVVDGFGATNIIRNPAISTCKYSFYIDAAGGSASTHGIVIGGYAFGSTSGLDTACESWRFFGTDFGGTPSVKIRSGADDTVLDACRWEASSSEVVIDSGVFRAGVISPSMINHIGTGPEITDNGSHTLILGSMVYTPSKLRAVRPQVIYSNMGVTSVLAAGAGQNVLDMSAGGVFLVTVTQSDGGTVWRAAAIVFSNGPVLTITTLASNLVTVSSTGATLRIVNAHPTDPQSLGWSVLKVQGPAQF